MLSYDYATIRYKSIAEEMELHWDSSEVEEWMTDVMEEQQNFYEMLNDNKMRPLLYSERNRTDLERRIAYAIYGPPSHLPDPKLNAETGYTRKQLKVVRNICNVILKHVRSSETTVSFLFICIKMKHVQLSLPVFRIPTAREDDFDEPTGEDMYIDSKCRVYHSWKDYLKNNKLPKCLMCYPQDGKYTATDNKVNVDFGESPASSLPKKVFTVLDVTTTLVATALGITALAIPVSAPIIIAAGAAGLASGIFGLTRSTRTLIDRHTHGQTLGLNSQEARGSWLGIVGNSVGLALGGINMVASSFVHGSRLIGLKVGAASLSISSSTLKGLNIVDHFANIGKKMIDEEEVTALDAFQMVSSVFFFTGSVVSTQSAFGTLSHMKSVGGDMKMTEILKTIQSRSAVNSSITWASKTTIDGEDQENEALELPEVKWPKIEEEYWRCNIL